MPEKKKNITNSIFDFVDLSQECDHVDEDDAEADDDHRHVAERGRGKKFEHSAIICSKMFFEAQCLSESSSFTGFEMLRCLADDNYFP